MPELPTASPAAREPRRVCAGCSRPASVCVCAEVVRVPTRTRVVILQHPRESGVPINTARLAELGLTNFERHVGVELDQSPRVAELLADEQAPAILLYPGDGALDLGRNPPPGPVTLVVIDGTWWQAKKLFRRNPALQKLPRYTFERSEPSRYRIRREPAQHCVSTVEAIVEALLHLERETPDVSALLGPFEAMVEHQLRFAREQGQKRHQATPRVARATRWPAALAERASDLVVGYGEANAWPRGNTLGADAEIVHLVAERVTSGERFEAFIAPRRALSPSFTHHTGLAPERVLEGESWPSFVGRWEAFLRPTDVLGAWGYFWSEALAREGARLPERLDLRFVARRFLRAKLGDVGECAEKLGEPLPLPWAPGRTGRRASGIVAVARALLRAAGTPAAAAGAYPVHDWIAPASST